MKKLSVEEKAKRYDEVLDRAKKEVNTCGSQDCDAARQIFRFFPELAESEDERIRKAILELVRQSSEILEKKNQEQMIAWLEKQGEQKPTDKVEPKFKVGDKIQYLKGCGTIMTIEKIENGEYIFGNNMGHTTIESGNKWHLVEQKPDWGDEDEMFVHGLIRGLAAKRDIHGHTTFSSDCIDITETINWLKSLKNRYIPQPKQEWSGGDEAMWAEISDLLWEGYKQSGSKFSWDDIRNWINPKLKFLRPQNTWKPSDEQMENLSRAFNGGTYRASLLMELYQDLKKLK